jgi:allantoin racemase
MRMWYQTMADISRYPAYGEALRSRAAGLLRPGTEVDVHGVQPGTYGELPPGRVSNHPLAYHVLLDQVVGNAIQAEREGCDVVVLGSYSEPHLRVIRSAVDIPVVSLAETTLLTGCQLAKKIGLVTVTHGIAWMVDHIVDNHQLRARTVPIKVTRPELDEDALVAALAEPDKVVELFVEASREAIAEYADVIIPAEGIFSQLLADRGIREIDGVSVMDCVAVTMLEAEKMAILHKETGLIQGRRWEYPKVDAVREQLLVQHAGRIPLSAARLGSS